MKYLISKLIVILVFSIFTLSIRSQNLTYSDLKYILEHDVESADTYITGKGFKYHDVQSGKNGGCDAMIWSFERDISTNRANAFIIKNCYEANYGFVWYQLGDKPTFEKIKSYCKSVGFRLTNTETSQFNELCTTFESTKFEIKFCSGLNTETNLNDYTIALHFK